MQLYFDESGDFAMPSGRDGLAGIVVGVDIPECLEAFVFEQYFRFVASLRSTECDKGEPKGKRLCDRSLRRFAELMARLDGVQVTTTVIHGGHPRKGEQIQTPTARKLRALAVQEVHQSMREETERLASQCENLSPAQFLRLMAWTVCVDRTLRDCITFRSQAMFNRCWDRMIFTIDPVNRRPGNREEVFFLTMLPAFLTGWTRGKPIPIAFKSDRHPFMSRFTSPAGIDIGGLIRGNLRWPSSTERPGLQIADICATLVAKGLRATERSVALQNYGLLMRRSPCEPRQAFGLHYIGDGDAEEISGPYALHTRAIAMAR